ncbi:Mitochondrial 5'-3' exonuclease and sliding exonuclease [Lodderomyces elongisporus]|uniref:Mitochondrial 5'-3' exonuclease and sliding exonuclease n=1 Tax=Lodderomyces elongisporus TaxID=36914 RepID=UPI00291EDB45|nr:Mitochondrial 5'-3' exonuclease and sliding exonuclease [Lodderomyces elongisporus]WLF76572.1 Mitochondrial 5'-3' exonuclease and sliding exonuclease [Lodderomyces elongisporus]
MSFSYRGKYIHYRHYVKSTKRGGEPGMANENEDENKGNTITDSQRVGMSSSVTSSISESSSSLNSVPPDVKQIPENGLTDNETELIYTTVEAAMGNLSIQNKDDLQTSRPRQSGQVYEESNWSSTNSINSSLLEKEDESESLFNISNQFANYSISQIRDFEERLDRNEEHAYVQSLISQLVYAAEPKVKTRGAKGKIKKKLDNLKTSHQDNVKDKGTDKDKDKAKDKNVVGDGEDLDDLGESQLLQNEKLVHIYENWHVPQDQNLPTMNPLHNRDDSSPFQFYKNNNTDKSITRNPRLSTTKMLIDNWCQLREYYEVFSGSIRTENEAMNIGKQHHANLEEETHPEILKDLGSINEFIGVKVEELKHFLKHNSVHDVQKNNEMDKFELEKEYVANNTISKQNLEDLLQIESEDLLALDWADQIIYRLFILLTRSHAREVLVHGHIDLKRHEFLSQQSYEVKEANVDYQSKLRDAILVSGVIDLLKLANPNDLHDYIMFVEAGNMIEFEFEKDQNQTPIIDLTIFLTEMKLLLKEYSTANLSLTLSDIKTRQRNSLPKQESVIAGAKLQTFYYRYMFEILGSNEHMGYEFLLKNAKARNLDVDKPLSPLTVLKILVKHHDLFYKDFVKLSRGESIGHEAFDAHTSASSSSSSFSTSSSSSCSSSTFSGFPTISTKARKPYHFHALFQDINEFSFVSPVNDGFLKGLEELQLEPKFDFDRFLKPLLRSWVTPPTLRYFAARASQFYRILNPFLGPETTVEYHNAYSTRNMKTMVYEYDEQELRNEVEKACLFWTGEAAPKFVDDRSKCKFCDFKSKCAVAKGELVEFGTGEELAGDGQFLSSKSVGPMLRKFLNENQSADLNKLQNESGNSNEGEQPPLAVFNDCLKSGQVTVPGL